MRLPRRSADVATLAMGWMGQRLAGRNELLAALGAMSRAAPGVWKRMFDEIMSDAAGKPWRCPAFDAMWSATWIPAKECASVK